MNFKDFSNYCSNTRALIIGDIMLDRYVFGDVNRISPEAPVPIFLSESHKHVLGGAGNVYNNLIYVGSGAKMNILTNNDKDLNFFRNNLYFGNVTIDINTAFEHHSSEIMVDPKLINPGSLDPNDYKLKSDSPAIGKGFLINGSNDTKDFIQNNGGRDYYGNPVSNSEKPNIGAHNGS